MSDWRFKCCAKDKRALIVAQGTYDEEVLNYISNLGDSEDEEWRYISIVLRYQVMKVPRGAWPGTQVYLSKAKLGIYSEYLGLYIRFWDRGYNESEWSNCETKYMVMRNMSQKEDEYEIQVHGRERDESGEG